MLKLSYRPFELLLKHSFTISKHSRTSTPLILLELSYEGFTGFGEASLVPYLGESPATASKFLSKAELSKFDYPFRFNEIIDYLDLIDPGNTAIKAAIDIALHDLKGKIEKKPCYSYYGSNPANMPVTSQTIGIDTPEVIMQKVLDASDCEVLKVKLGSANDKLLISTIREVTDKPLYVDANQGWKDVNFAIDMAFWLKEQGVELIEQPLDRLDVEGNARVTEKSPLPIVADEAVWRLPDVANAAGVYHGINIKLMKSAGMSEADAMINKARELGLQVLIGCMSETSCATLAAAALAPLCDWADLDGPFLTKNNPYKSPSFERGKWVLTEKPGLGLEQLDVGS